MDGLKQPSDSSVKQPTRPIAQGKTRSVLGSMAAGRGLAWALGLGVACVATFCVIDPFAAFMPDGSLNNAYDTHAFNDWSIDKNCVMQLSKAYLWLFTLVAGSVPLSQIVAWCAAPHLPAWCVQARPWRSPLKRSGWTWSALLATALTLAFQCLSLALVAAYFYYPDNDTGMPYWASNLPAGATGVSNADRWVYAIGDAAAWPCLYAFTITFLTIGRTNQFLELLGLNAEDVRWFHILNARLAVLWAALHGVACAFPAWHAGGWEFMQWVMVEPLSSGSGLYNWAGWMALFLSIVVVLTSWSVVRRLSHELFRWSHWLFLPMLFFSTLHMGNTWWWYHLPLAFLGADLAHRWVVRARYGVLAEVQQLASDGSACLLTLPNLAGAQPGADVYVRVPGLGCAQWHALTVAGPGTTRDGKPAGLLLVAGSAGGWSHSLCALAGVARAVLVDVEGPYAPGAAATQATRAVAHLVVRKSSAGGNRALVLAGGAGAAVLGELLAAYEHLSSGAADHVATPPLSNLEVVWAARSGAMANVLFPCLRQLVALGARVRVHVSGSDVRRPNGHHAGAAPTSADAAPLDPERQQQQQQGWTAEAGVVRSVAPGGSPTWVSFGVKTAMLYLALGAGAALFVAGSAICCSHHEWMASPEQQQLDVAAYHAVVATNYFTQTGQNLTSDQWPPGQALLPTESVSSDPDVATLSVMTCTLAGAQDLFTLMCNPNSDAETMPYGRPPTVPCDAGSAYVMGRCSCMYFVPYIFATCGLLLVPLLVAWLAGLATRAWHRHRRAAGQSLGAPGGAEQHASTRSSSGDDDGMYSKGAVHGTSQDAGGKQAQQSGKQQLIVTSGGRLDLAELVSAAACEAAAEGADLLLCLSGSAPFKAAASNAVQGGGCCNGGRRAAQLQVVDLSHAAADRFWW